MNSYLQDLQNFYNSKAPEGFVYVKGMDFKGNEKLSPKSEVFIKNRKIHIDDFMMCDRPVTQAEFKAIFPEGYKPFFESDMDKGEVQGNRPAEMVSWYDAIAYCNKRSVLEGLTPCYTIPGVTDMECFSWKNFLYLDIPTYIDTAWDGAVYNQSTNGYRLPTEIEWEYAARSGFFLESSRYSGSDDIDEVACYCRNSWGRAHKLKKKPPNRLGLYDMSGNVMEWCWDWHDNINTSTPGTGNASGSYRVVRGGSWACRASQCTVSYQDGSRPHHRSSDYSFRVVRSRSN